MRHRVSPRRHVVEKHLPSQLLLTDPRLLADSLSIIDSPFLCEIKKLSKAAAKVDSIARCFQLASCRINFSIFEVRIGVAHDGVAEVFNAVGDVVMGEAVVMGVVEC